jgi:hypothetical protein
MADSEQTRQQKQLIVTELASVGFWLPAWFVKYARKEDLNKLRMWAITARSRYAQECPEAGIDPISDRKSRELNPETGPAPGHIPRPGYATPPDSGND